MAHSVARLYSSAGAKLVRVRASVPAGQSAGRVST